MIFQNHKHTNALKGFGGHSSINENLISQRMKQVSIHLGLFSAAMAIIYGLVFFLVVKDDKYDYSAAKRRIAIASSALIGTLGFYAVVTIPSIANGWSDPKLSRITYLRIFSICFLSLTMFAANFYLLKKAKELRK